MEIIINHSEFRYINYTINKVTKIDLNKLDKFWADSFNTEKKKRDYICFVIIKELIETLKVKNVQQGLIYLRDGNYYSANDDMDDFRVDITEKYKIKRPVDYLFICIKALHEQLPIDAEYNNKKNSCYNHSPEEMKESQKRYERIIKPIARKQINWSLILRTKNELGL
jgi:hypothetical protein